MTRDEMSEEPQPRPVDSLTRLERKWLKRRYCGFCEASLVGNSCYAMRGAFAPVPTAKPCNMDVQRAKALQHYKPRASLLSEKGEG